MPPSAQASPPSQAATKHSHEHARLAIALSALPALETLELSQPAVTPDLTLLRLFYQDLASAFPCLSPYDLVQTEQEPCLPSLDLLFLEPPSFRTLYDGASPIMFPSGPVTVQSLLPLALTAPTTPLASSLRCLLVRGHSLPLLCPPLLLLACPRLHKFSMTGHACGSSRHYTLSAIHNFQENFLLPALRLASSALPPSALPFALTTLTLLDPYSGESVATHDLFSQTVSRSSLLPSSLSCLPHLCPALARLEISSNQLQAITSPAHLNSLASLPHLSHLTIDSITPAALLPCLSDVGPRLRHLRLTRTSLTLGPILASCPNLHSLVLHSSKQVSSSILDMFPDNTPLRWTPCPHCFLSPTSLLWRPPPGWRPPPWRLSSTGSLLPPSCLLPASLLPPSCLPASAALCWSTWCWAPGLSPLLCHSHLHCCWPLSLPGIYNSSTVKGRVQQLKLP